MGRGERGATARHSGGQTERKEHLANIEQNVYALIIPQAVGVAAPELPARRPESWNKAINQ